MSAAGGEAPEALRARLEASRAALLAAIARLTEADFASDLGGDGAGEGESVAAALAALAADERAAVAVARGEPPPPARGIGGALAPQAIHDLAGSRHATLRALDAIGAGGDRGGTIAAAIGEAAAREEAAAARIAARFGANPPPPP